MENKIDIGSEAYVVVNDSSFRLSQSGVWQAPQGVYLDRESARNLTKLFKEQGWLDEPEYEVVEVSCFDGLTKGDVLDKSGKVIDHFGGSHVAWFDTEEKDGIFRSEFDHFESLKVRRGKKKCVVETWVRKHTPFPLNEALDRDGFKPGDKVRVTVEGM